MGNWRLFAHHGMSKAVQLCTIFLSNLSLPRVCPGHYLKLSKENSKCMHGQVLSALSSCCFKEHLKHLGKAATAGPKKDAPKTFLRRVFLGHFQSGAYLWSNAGQTQELSQLLPSLETSGEWLVVVTLGKFRKPSETGEVLLHALQTWPVTAHASDAPCLSRQDT